MANNLQDPGQNQQEARRRVVMEKATDVMSGSSYGITIDEAAQLGMDPKLHQDGAWGVSAEAIFELDTEVHGTVELYEAQAADSAREASALASAGTNWETHTPSGRGLKRTGKESMDAPLFPRRER